MHKSIGENEAWSIDIIGGVIEIESKVNTSYIRITEDDGHNVITIRLKKPKEDGFYNEQQCTILGDETT